MALRIMNNISAQFAQRQLGLSNQKLGKSLERLSSGYRINHASDDAAGLSISERMRYQIGGMDQAMRNVQDGISIVQVAEGGIEELTSMLQRMRVLAVQASNGTMSSSDRLLLQTEVTQLVCEIDRMQSTVTFNGVSLLANADGSIKIQVGAGAGEQLSVALRTSGSNSITSITTSNLGDGTNTIASLQITNVSTAQTAMSTVTSALNQVIKLRSVFGAAQKRLESSYNFLGIQKENMTAAESRIRDVDFASEMTDFTRNQIMVQASTAMLAQSNLVPTTVLQLLGQI